MTRRVLLLLAGLGLAGAAPGAAQQVYFYPEKYYGFGADTAFIVPVGRTERLQLYGIVNGGVSAYSVTVFVDTARLRIVGADSVPGYGLPSPTLTREAADRITLTASGEGYSSSAYLASIAVQGVPGATTGSLFSVRVNSWTNQAGASVDVRTIQTDIENGCLAYALWGDPDSSLSVTGRDALIALTHAVGLPVSGFDLALADVDEDGTITSRDALLMLSYAIGSGYYYSYRAGVPVAGRCAPLAGVPSDMAFLRGSAAGNLYRVPAGDSIAVPVGSSTAFYTSQLVRWAPDGTRILGTAYIGTPYYYYSPVAVTVATAVEDTLVRYSSFDGGGTYSPDGTRIAFFSDSASQPVLWLMNATGGNRQRPQTVVTVTNYASTNAAWSPTAPRVAFTGYLVGGATTNGLWSVRIDSTDAVRQEFPANASYPPMHPVWSPAGDSLLFVAGGRLYAVAAPDTATVPKQAVSLSGSLDYPSWTSAGILFKRKQGTSTPTTYDYYLRRPDGRILRVYRATSTDAYGAHFR